MRRRPAPRRASATAAAILAAACAGAQTGAPESGAGRRAPEVGDLGRIGIPEIRSALEAGRYTVLDLARAHLARIETYEGVLNAFVSMNPSVERDARSLDEELSPSGPRGPLHGVPVVVKDNIDVAGLPTTAGFDGFSAATGGVDMIPGRDATVVARLRAAGALILGKTNMPDFAGHGTRTNSSVAGVTRNPYALDRVPGGSSGGSATAVNAGFAVVGLGTETGGSIQNPAAAQALVGVKPTFGLVPMDGVVPIDATYRDVVGPLARSVRDAAIVLDVIAGPTPEDPATYASVGHVSERRFVESLDAEALGGRRFGLVGPGWRDSFLPLAIETEARYREAIAVLESRGASVVPDPFEGTAWVERYASQPRVPSTGSYGMLTYLRRLGPEAAFHSVEEWEALTGREFRGGRRRPPARPSATEEGDAFQAWRMEMRALFRSVLDEHDLDGLFFPQAGAPIGPLVEDPERPSYNPNNHPELPSNIVNDIGLPVVTVPFAYYDDGTPFVIAFVGDLWSDHELLAWAYDFEGVTRARRPPDVAAAARTGGSR